MLTRSQILQKRLNELINKENIEYFLNIGCQFYFENAKETNISIDGIYTISNKYFDNSFFHCTTKVVDGSFSEARIGTFDNRIFNSKDYVLLGRPIDLGVFCLAIGRIQNIQIDFSEYNNYRETFIISIESLDIPVPTFDCEIEYDCSKDFHSQDEDVYNILEELFDYEESWIAS